MRQDLESAQPRVMSLQDTANTLLMTSESDDTRQAKDRLVFITNQMKSLLRMCATYMKRIEELRGGHGDDAPSVSIIYYFSTFQIPIDVLIPYI